MKDKYEVLKNAKVGDLVLFKFVEGYNSGFITAISELEKTFWISLRLYNEFKYQNAIYPGYQNYKFNIEDIEEFEILKTDKDLISEKSSFDERVEECAEKIINGFLYKSTDYEFEKNKINEFKKMANIIKEEIITSIKTASIYSNK